MHYQYLSLLADTSTEPNPGVLHFWNEVGGRFNGGELPTTVIVDAQGRVRRRFIGARSLPVFEAMITEASPPWQAGLR